MFGIQQVLISAVVGAVASFAVLYFRSRYWRDAPFESRSAVVLSILVGLSILLFRLGANVAQLNDDPIPLASPNDLLCPVATYVVLSVYAGLRGALDRTRFERDRALLTLVSLVVNIVTI
jgi:uncharacterized membrane-anchored protein